MTSLSERINSLVDHYASGNVSKFAALVGFSEANIRNYLKGTLPKSEFLSALMDKFDVC